jgi:2-polyprenyl-3-methyl-5-hydroxy-6-metoxy-1,4-benzoquinol methylase
MIALPPTSSEQVKDRDFLSQRNEARYSSTRPWSYGDSLRMQAMRKMLHGSKTILDIGCYDGSLSSPVAREGENVFGIDNSKGACLLAKKNGIKPIVAELSNHWPIQDSSVDAIMAGEVIEHVLDVDQFIAEALRVLKPEGLFIVSTPNLAALGRRLMLLLGINPHIEVSLSEDAAGHLRYFTKRTLIDLIQKHGFHVTSFTSDVVNFNASGGIRSALLAKIFPTMGRCLIASFKKV